MTVKIRNRLTALAVSLAIVPMMNVSAAGLKCPAGLEPAGEFRMFFGLADSEGKTVSEEEWQGFLADTITPRFRAGLTVLAARGQWLAPDGNLQREPVRVVMGAIAADAEGGMKLVDEISAAYQARFGQDPVFRMWNPACAGVYRP